MRARLGRRRAGSFLALSAVGTVVVATVAWLTAGSAAGASPSPQPSTSGQHRQYYIAADTVTWDFAPQGFNVITGQPFGDVENTYLKPGPGRIGSKHELSLYHQYTDDTFTTLVPRAPEDDYMGILGPVIRAEVGDTIDVLFRNNTPFPASMHPHGLLYAKDAEGAPYNDGTSGEDKADDAVPTGGTVTYHWQVPERAGPGPMDASSVLWMYHSHTNEIQDTNSGLVGPIVVTRAGQARPDGSPMDVDREVFAYFSVMNENESLYLDRDLAAAGPRPEGDSDDEFEESNLMHEINGYVYGNGPLIDMVEGTRVRWYVMSLGTEVDLHTPHWHGNTVLMNDMNRTDMVQLLPGSMVVADMQPDDVGIWLFHCHVNDHIAAGMQTRYEVLPAGSQLGIHIGGSVAQARPAEVAALDPALVARFQFFCRMLLGSAGLTEYGSHQT
jgi:FtsP/CotA-like multicopper oxidase with cupredoxin domain